MKHLSVVVNQIKQRREMLKITQEVLADLSGVGLRTIKHLEAGNANPTYKTLAEIFDVLGMEMILQVKKPNSK
jgi:transcriptional regulator with XRE-family HTH domain